jgi:hypothetical protein
MRKELDKNSKISQGFLFKQIIFGPETLFHLSGARTYPNTVDMTTNQKLCH